MRITPPHTRLTVPPIVCEPTHLCTTRTCATAACPLPPTTACLEFAPPNHGATGTSHSHATFFAGRKDAATTFQHELSRSRRRSGHRSSIGEPPTVSEPRNLHSRAIPTANPMPHVRATVHTAHLNAQERRAYNEKTKTGEARRAARSEERHNRRSEHTTVQVPAKAASRADGTRDAARTCDRTHGGRRDPDPGAKIGATAGGASAEPGTLRKGRGRRRRHVCRTNAPTCKGVGTRTARTHP